MLRAASSLFRFRVAGMVALSCVFGYLLAAGAAGPDMVTSAAGTFLLTCACSVFNQIQEKDLDARMPRTRNRPVASGRLPTAAAWAVGMAALLPALILLHAAGGVRLVLLSAAVLALYNGVYTPMKKYTAFSLLAGAVPGALPPVFGWLAAGGNLYSPEIALLFIVYYLWQVPHFWLRAERDRQSYLGAGLPLPSVELPHRYHALLRLWYASYMVALLLLPVFPFIAETAVRIAVCLAGITGLAASGYLLASPVRGFHAVNVSMLFVMLLLVADRLVTSGIIT